MSCADERRSDQERERGDVRILVRPYDDPQVVALVAAVQQEYVERYGGPDDAVVAVEEFSAPGGIFLVALLDGAPAAMGGWRRVDEATAEIKRMFVVSAARGRGLARLLLAELEGRAQEAGIGRLILNTGTEQPETIALYESSGYETAEAYGHYADQPGALFYARRLTPPT